MLTYFAHACALHGCTDAAAGVTLVDERSTTAIVLVLCALLVGTVVAACALGSRSWLRVPGAAVATGSAVAWLLVSGPVEGRTLLRLTPRNGLSVADLLVAPAVVVVGVLCWQAYRDRPRP